MSITPLDRIDIHIEVPRVDYEKLNGDAGESIRLFHASGYACRGDQAMLQVAGRKSEFDVGSQINLQVWR